MSHNKLVAYSTGMVELYDYRPSFPAKPIGTDLLRRPRSLIGPFEWRDLAKASGRSNVLHYGVNKPAFRFIYSVLGILVRIPGFV